MMVRLWLAICLLSMPACINVRAGMAHAIPISGCDTSPICHAAHHDGNGLSPAVADSTANKGKKKGSLLKRAGRAFGKLFNEFNNIDTCYIEPQHYNFTVMLQNTNTYEMYEIQSKNGQKVTFAPKPSMKIGPYVGWRWVFLGYTLDINHISNDDNKKEFDLSLYSSMLGVDLYYRKTGTDYNIKSARLMEKGKTYKLNDIPFSGLNVGIKGFDLYYIFNHRKFSYPAAFSQSTCQKKSCGSPLIGIGYTDHSLKLDYEKLRTTLTENIPNGGEEVKLDSGLMFKSIRYSSYSVSGGYAYNWVFARNWLACASLSVALAYKQSKGNIQGKDNDIFRDFNFENVNIDGVGRFSVVWNNTKWYAGASTILHSYSYNKKQFSTNNLFGSLNIYVGLNFGKKKEYKK